MFLALASAAFLIASFPNVNQPWCAWIALVPWLALLRGRRSRAAFGWSYLIGLLFFLGSMWWLVFVTVIGWVALCAYLALYFGAFGVVASRVAASRRSPLASHVLLASAWAGLEYLRSHLLSGLGWNLLGYSQTPWLPVIQLADLTGAWGVSFVIVFVNAALARLLTVATSAQAQARIALTVLAMLLGVAGYGAWRLPRVIGERQVRVAVVQGNIPQHEKWDAGLRHAILARYEALTREAAATFPQLVIWPETSVPDYFGLEEPVSQRVFSLAESLHLPLLVGAPMVRFGHVDWSVTNSAALVDAGGLLTQRYDKLHLVPFGEFIPFERAARWLRDVLPPIGDFSPGSAPTVFRIPSTPGAGVAPFGVLICFEDAFPRLARRFVLEGARWLAVITNDAWFGPTAAAYQHAQASTLRAVELRVPVARAANTGWSGCIDATGAWRERVRDGSGAELFVSGTATCDLPMGAGESLYLRWGDWFAWLCLLAAGWGIMKGLQINGAAQWRTTKKPGSAARS